MNARPPGGNMASMCLARWSIVFVGLAAALGTGCGGPLPLPDDGGSKDGRPVDPSPAVDAAASDLAPPVTVSDVAFQEVVAGNAGRLGCRSPPDGTLAARADAVGQAPRLRAGIRRADAAERPQTPAPIDTRATLNSVVATGY